MENDYHNPYDHRRVTDESDLHNHYEAPSCLVRNPSGSLFIPPSGKVNLNLIKILNHFNFLCFEVSLSVKISNENCSYKFAETKIEYQKINPVSNLLSFKS